MENRHLIAKQIFELRVGFNTGDVPQLQNAFSQHYWQSVVPAFEQLFDRLVAPDELVRVDKLELDIGRWSSEDIALGRFVENLVFSLESAISQALQGSGAGIEVKPLRIGRFDLWLYFLGHGFLPSHAAPPESSAEWQQQIIECLNTESRAGQRLRNLLSENPVAVERLILQHDAVFLQQLLGIIANDKQVSLIKSVNEIIDVVVGAINDVSDQLHTSSEEKSLGLARIADALFYLLANLLGPSLSDKHSSKLKRRLSQALNKETSSPATLERWLSKTDSWVKILDGVTQPELSLKLNKRIITFFNENKCLRKVVAEFASVTSLSKQNLMRQVELVVWRRLIDAVVVNKEQLNTDALIARVAYSDTLLPWREVLTRKLGVKSGGSESRDTWTRMADVIRTLPVLMQERSTEPAKPDLAGDKPEMPLSDFVKESSLSDAEEGDVFYVQAAGAILFHPFLNRFFQTLNLCEGGDFINEACRQKAVVLLHHLATGDVHTPEYQLVLPKFLCGMPFNAPLDHLLEIEEAEKLESENLMRAAIEHWGALGNSSPDWLREMFLLRDGKLEKRENGWYLLIERKAQDILLDRLPHGWGLGVVKLPWMDGLLRVDW